MTGLRLFGEQAMIVVESIDKALACLLDDHVIAKVTIDYPGLTSEYLVAGTLMGKTKNDWRHVFIMPGCGEMCGLLDKKTFLKLYRNYYIENRKESCERARIYALNYLCPIQEYSRFKRQVDCWSEYNSTQGGSSDVSGSNGGLIADV